MNMTYNYSEFYKRIENSTIDPQKEIPCFNFLKHNNLSLDYKSYRVNELSSFVDNLYGMRSWIDQLRHQNNK